MWNAVFNAGSVLASLTQRYMVGQWVIGFRDEGRTTLFLALIAVCLPGTYTLLCAGWPVIETEGALQLAAVRWARQCLGLTAVGVLAISAATPVVSPAIFEHWFSLPCVVLLAPVPLATVLLFFIVERALRRSPTLLVQGNDCGDWVPFVRAVGIVVLAF